MKIYLLIYIIIMGFIVHSCCTTLPKASKAADNYAEYIQEHLPK